LEPVEGVVPDVQSQLGHRFDDADLAITHFVDDKPDVIAAVEPVVPTATCSRTGRRPRLRSSGT
jgi:hypothetical protein